MAFGSGALCTHEGLRPGSLQLLAGKQLVKRFASFVPSSSSSLASSYESGGWDTWSRSAAAVICPLFRNRDKVLQLLDIHAPAFHERAPSLLLPPAILYKL